MHMQHAPRASTESRERHSYARVPRRWLLLARGLWLALVILTLAIFFASLPDYVTELQTVCRLAACPLGQLSPDQVVTFQHFGLSVGSYTAFMVALTIVFALVSFGTGGLIFWRKSDDWMALLFALLSVVGGTVPVLFTVGTSHSVWRLPILCVTELLLLSFFLTFTLFPQGRFVPRWTRWLFVVFSIASVVFTFFTNFLTSVFTPPLWLGVPFVLLFFSLYASLVIAQMYRYRYVSTLVQRQQTKWVVYGFTANIVVSLGAFLPLLIFPRSLSSLLFIPVFIGAAFLYPFTMGVAILRYRLWDIDVLINRTLVYGALTVSVIGLYILVVVGLGTLIQARGNLLLSLLATGLIAVLFQPLRARLQRGVNRLMYGERDDPYAVLSRLASRLEATLAPEALLPTLVETVAQALKFPSVAIALKQGDVFIPAASYGHPQDHPFILPLVYHTETIGQLRLSPRAPGEAFTAADRRLLEDIAHQAGVAAHAVRLTSDLQRSRERLVTAREEERRRLRRDLHDGLGATLAALHLQAGAIRTLMRHDLAAADAEMLDLQAEIRSAIADIRRLVYALRPPTLDELGLVGAIRQYAAQYDLKGAQSASDGCLHVTVEAPEHLPALPAAVEVAAYRIVQEALTNVARHAHARACTVRLVITDAFQLSISDDGVGFQLESGAGVGLLSMRERAAESGGSCLVESAPGRGTRILVHLPLAKE